LTEINRKNENELDLDAQLSIFANIWLDDTGHRVYSLQICLYVVF